jgi:hypothetical protein
MMINVYRGVCLHSHLHWGIVLELIRFVSGKGLLEFVAR